MVTGTTHDGPQLHFLYNAFLSYSHSPDAKLALALQRALHRFAKRPFRLRALRVFCDSASMGANPALWPAIEHALTNSEYLILMASPQAAASPWVEKEVDYWRRNKPASNVLIALTAGEITWGGDVSDFDWTRTTALPIGLSRLFESEPLWVDLRWAHESSNLLAHPRFRECVAELAAPLHGRAKDELIGEDLRQGRQLRRLGLATIALLALLVLALGWMSLEANRRRQIAALERDRALTSQSRYLADATLRQIAEGKPDLGVLLALEALPKAGQERPYVPEAEAALYSALSALGLSKIARVSEGHPVVSSASFSPDGERLVTVDAEETAKVWNADTGMQVATLQGHQKPVWFAAYLPDGSGIITGSADGTARLWDAESGEQIRVFQGHEGPVLHGAISNDGRLLATASADSTARVWQINTGSLLAILRGHIQPLCCIQLSPDASRVATASTDGTARLWDTRSGKMLAVFKNTPQALSSSAGQAVVLKFSPDGRLLATSHEDNTLRLWYASDGSRAAVLKGGSGNINDGAFSKDSGFFALASADGAARLWRLRWRNNDELAPVPDAMTLRQKQDTPDSDAPNAVVFNPENNSVAVAGDFLEVWDSANAGELAAMKLEAPATSVVTSRDGRRFATVHVDHVTLWKVAGANFTRWRLQETREQIERAHQGPITELTGTEPGFTWTNYRGWEPPVALTRDSSTAAVVTGRGVVLVNGQTGRVISTIAAHSQVISRAVFNASGDRLLTTSYDGSAKIWDARNGAALVTLTGHEGPILDGAWSPADDFVATASEDHTVRLWDTKGGSNSILRGHAAAVRRVAFSGDGKRLSTVSEDRTARVWDVASDRELLTVHGDKKGFGVAVLNASGDRVLTAGSGSPYAVRLWETATGRELHEWQESRGTVTGLAFSSDGRVVLEWGADGVARLRRANGNYDRLSDVGSGCSGPGSIAHAHLSDDGERVITILRNGRTDLWDSRSGTAVLTLYSFPGRQNASPCEFSLPAGPEIASVATSPDLRNVLVDREDGAVVLLSLPSRAEAMRLAQKLVPRALTRDERRRFFLPE